jgi:hypothetical protein
MEKDGGGERTELSPTHEGQRSATVAEIVWPVEGAVMVTSLPQLDPLAYHLGGSATMLAESGLTLKKQKNRSAQASERERAAESGKRDERSASCRRQRSIPSAHAQAEGRKNAERTRKEGLPPAAPP